MPKQDQDTPEQLRAWVATWKAAGAELERMRAEELRSLTEAQAAAKFEKLAIDPAHAWRSPARQNGEGLVEQQRLFMLSHEHPARHCRRP